MAYEDRKNRTQQLFLPSANGITIPIPPNFSILQGKLILKGSVTLAAGTVNGIAIGDGGPLNLIKRIRLVANPAAGSPYPGGYLVDCSPRSLIRWAQLQHFGKLILEQAGSTLGNGANGTYPIYLAIPIYFADTNLRNQVATALYADPSAYESLQLQIDTGTITDCFSGNNATPTFNLYFQWTDDRADIVPPATAVSLFQEDHLIQIGGANTRLFDPALPQDGAFLSWQLLCEQGQPGLTLSDAILNRLQVYGPTYSFDEYSNDIRQKMYDDEWLDPSQNGAGLFYIDMTNGVVQNANPAANLDVRLDVNNPSGAYQDQVRFMSRRIFVVQAKS